MKVSYWVMRVVMHQGPGGVKRAIRMRDLTEETKVVMSGLIVEGAYAVMPDGCIVEPVEGFDDQLDADARREIEAKKRPGEDFRVAMTMGDS